MTEQRNYYEKGLGGGRNTLDARRFWEAAQDEYLFIQYCEACGEYIFPPQDVCAYCWSDDLVWKEVSGDGIVHTFSTVYVDLHPSWRDRLPYTLAAVRLDQGVYLISLLVECDPKEIDLDMPVEVTFGELPDENGLFPVFRPR